MIDNEFLLCNKLFNPLSGTLEMESHFAAKEACGHSTGKKKKEAFLPVRNEITKKAKIQGPKCLNETFEGLSCYIL